MESDLVKSRHFLRGKKQINQKHLIERDNNPKARPGHAMLMVRNQEGRWKLRDAVQETPAQQGEIDVSRCPLRESAMEGVYSKLPLCSRTHCK
ncbi:hypothetical protein BaRGS_00015847 [Batillaria attramentaria]|uniref:Uncharacterized protein n=1 Tax=Batillaria attramentaria TaxID=370345 RepID=A0ABD0L0J8_9CAEN